MVMVEPNFVGGVVRKSLVLGALSAVAAYFFGCMELAQAVAIGTVLSATNLGIMAISIRKMLDAARDGKGSAGVWSLIFSLKMAALIAIVWVLIARWNVDPIGFVLGFSLFMPAIGWQMLVSKPEEAEDVDEEE